MGIHVDVNLSNLDSRFNATNNKRARQTLGRQAITDMDRLVPYRQGEMSRNVILNSDAHKIIYTVPYARAQFYGIIHGSPVLNYTTKTHPQAGKRWDLRGKAMFAKDWMKVVKAAYNNYGGE